MALWLFVLQCWYLMLPGLLANLVPPLVKKVPFLDYPIDFKRRFQGDYIFGHHKTFRGFFFGIIIAIMTVFVQGLLFKRYELMQSFSLLNYPEHCFTCVGFLMGFGALFGDAVKSFFKRRAHIAAGKPWFPFDQIDFIIGWLLFTAIVFVPSWQIALVLIITVPILHIITNHIGFYIGVNKEKW